MSVVCVCLYSCTRIYLLSVSSFVFFSLRPGNRFHRYRNYLSLKCKWFSVSKERSNKADRLTSQWLSPSLETHCCWGEGECCNTKP